MPRALIFGAGANGAGFVARNAAEHGYDIVFVDTCGDAISRVEEGYGVDVVSLEGRQHTRIDNVVDGIVPSKSTEAILAREVADCDLIVTAVGKDNLVGLVEYLRMGLELFVKEDAAKNIILAENKEGGASFLEQQLADILEDPRLASRVGIADSIVHVMGKPTSPITSEAYSEDDFVVDAAKLCDPFPDLTMKPYSPFLRMIHRKLYIHNLMHMAIGAYAARLGCEKVPEAVAVPEIRSFVAEVTGALCYALMRAYGEQDPENFGREAIFDHRMSLYERAANTYLDDDVARLIRNPGAKLSSRDRVVGAALFCMQHHADARPAARVAAMALDLPALKPEAEADLSAAIDTYTGLGREHQILKRMIMKEYQGL